MNVRDVARILLLLVGCVVLYQMFRYCSALSSEGYQQADPMQAAAIKAALMPSLPPMAHEAAYPSLPANYTPASPGTPINNVPIMEPPATSALDASIRPISEPGAWNAAGNESCFPRDQLTAEDLLPKDVDPRWAELHPEGQGSLRDKNFLEAGYLAGINTVGQVLKNANYGLRSDPPIPRIPNVSPWGVSTIEDTDQYRRPLDIGA
jgi:hypothetical protein